MKTLIGLLLILAGIALGLYVGIWLCFIGGIVDVINAIKTTPVPALQVAVGVAKVIFSGFLGQLSFWLSAVVGLAFIQSDN
jgi:uncharacterized membrane protein